MNRIFFLIPLLFIIVSVLTPDVFAEIEKGRNYDIELIGINQDNLPVYKWTSQPERIQISGEWLDYRFTDYPTSITIETAHGSISVDKTTCGFSFFPSGIISGSPLFTDSIIARMADFGTDNWVPINSVNNAACVVSWDDQSETLTATKLQAGIGLLEYKYISVGEKWKTQLEATNLSGVTNKKFGFTQTIDLNRDTVHYGGNNINLDNYNGTTFDRQWLENNKGNVIDFMNGHRFDLDIGFDNLWSVTVEDTGNDSSKLSFDYTRNAIVILPGETLIVDPTYANSAPTTLNLRDNNGSNTCDDTGGTYGNFASTDYYTYVYSGGANDCIRAYTEFNTSGIPIGQQFDSGLYNFTTSAVHTTRSVDIHNIDLQPTTRTDAQAFDEIDDGALLGNVAIPGTGLQTLTFDASDLSVLQAAYESHGAWIALGHKLNDESYTGSTEGSLHFSDTGTTPPQLTLVYSPVPPPDAVDDLSSPSQTFGSVNLAWTQPELNGGNLTGYQINYTTPQGNPNIVITNNTQSTDTSAVVSNLSIGTPYTFGVSAWTENGNNVTKPYMLWLNVTTSGNFTIGTALFNQTNNEVLPITFEEQSINSTAKFLNVTFANTYTMACDFHYKFANTNQTYTNLDSYAVSSTLNETSFIFNNFENEIIDVYCYDTITSTDADYLLIQSDFPLLQQIASFRDGTYGTEGKIGVFDFITIAVVIFSMIGLNRVNESVGAIFNVVLLGALSYFGIIELPTIIFGIMAVVMVFVITSTRKT